MRSKNIISKEVVLTAVNPFRRKTKITTPGGLRLLFVFAVLVLFCAAGVGTAAADTVTVSNLTELSAAISGAPTDNSEQIIVIAGDIGAVITSAYPKPKDDWIPAIRTGQNITLTPAADKDYRIYPIVANFLDPFTTGLLTIDGGSLTIIDNGTSTLVLDGNGSSLFNNEKSLACVKNSGTFTMFGGLLTNNIANHGGGVLVRDNASFIMNGGTISGNLATTSYGGVYGGGVSLEDNAVFTMNGGSITGNSANLSGVGGGVNLRGNSIFTMTGGEITNNTCDMGTVNVGIGSGTFTMSGDALIANNTVESAGGGVWLSNTGTFNMGGNSVISGNTATNGGGAVESSGTFNMSGNAVISGNTAGYGGSVLNSGTFTMSGNALIANNTVVSYGGGVYNVGTFTMESGDISDNRAAYGGGVYSYGTFNMESGTISSNTATSYGGGVYNDGTFTMESGDISGNKVSGSGGGGGVYSYGTFNMADGSISDNWAPSGTGVYAYIGTFTMTGGEITNNTGTSGGVRVHNCTFAMSGDAVIAGNNVSNGGGVDIYDNGSFLMSGSAGITNNIATNTGGGVLINHAAGKFEMSDSARITGNTATNTGGGVRVAAGQLTMSGSSVITGNIANNGNGVYVSTNAAFLKSGSARVNPMDEVYLSNNTFINITSQYLGETLNITHAVNVTGTKVIELHQNVAIDTYSESFGLSPLMVPFYLKYNVTESNVSIYELALLSPPTPTPTTTSTTPVPTTTPTNGGNTSNSFRVLFETFGGSYVPPATGLSYGDLVPVPVSPTKDGYTFGGWYRDEACTIAWIFATDAVPGDMTLYAKWIGGVVPTATASPTTPTAAPTWQPVAPPPIPPPIETPVPIVIGDVPDDSGPDNGIIYFFLLLLFLIFLFLILLLRHTVTFLVTTAEGVEKYRVKVWHGKKIDTDDLPELIRETSWYADEEREEYWDLVEERVTKSIRLYPGIR